MKIALEVKNNSKIIKPSKNDVIIHDGKQWYVTTKSDIFHEYEEKIDAKLRELQELINSLAQDNASFKENVSKQVLDISNIVEAMYKNQ